MPQPRPYPSDAANDRWTLIGRTPEQGHGARLARLARRVAEVNDPIDLRSVWNAIL